MQRTTSKSEKPLARRHHEIHGCDEGKLVLEIADGRPVVSRTKELPSLVVDVVRNKSDGPVGHQNSHASGMETSCSDHRGTVSRTTLTMCGTILVLGIGRQQNVKRSLFVNTNVPELARLCSLAIGARCTAAAPVIELGLRQEGSVPTRGNPNALSDCNQLIQIQTCTIHQLF